MIARFRLIESGLTLDYSRCIARACRMIPKLRAAYGIPDHLLGTRPDTRAAPSRGMIGSLLILNRTERAIRNLVERPFR